MEILGPKFCPKHNLQADKICTNVECFQEKDILVCSNCSSKHLTRHCDVINVALLNDKVHELMKKRYDFQLNYQQSCDEWLTQLRKFKVFKEQITTVLNVRERALNEICRKIRRIVPYQKDKHLFKKTLNHLYLATRAINPNYDLYEQFNNTLAETISQCNRCIHSLRLNRNEISLLLKKQHQICAIIKECQNVKLSVPPIKWCEPQISQFRKETIKYNKNIQAEHIDSKIYRLSDEEFLAHNTRSRVINLYNSKNLSLPKSLYIGSEVEHLQVFGKNLFLTNQHNHIFIYDLLNERVIKEYASSNHKEAQITELLAIDSSHVLNFIHNPNQIVSLRFDDGVQALQVSKGHWIKHKCFAAANLDHRFAASFDDQTVKLFSIEKLQVEGEYELQNLNAKSLAIMDNQTILAGGESELMYLMDQRAQGIVAKINLQTTCLQIKKFQPNTILVNLSNCIKLYDYRMQKQMLKMSLDNPIKYVEVMTSGSFVTSGKQLSFYEGIA